MYRFILLFIFLFSFICRAQTQNKSTGEIRPSVLKQENNWNKSESENPQNALGVTTVDGVTYSSTNEGIFLTLPKAKNNIKLFALTGEVFWSGDLVQGRFFIPARRGIYFLRINNKSYKVVCK